MKIFKGKKARESPNFWSCCERYKLTMLIILFLGFLECHQGTLSIYLTLRFLASGDSQQSLTFSLRISASTVSRIIDETSATIWEKLSEYTRPPKSEIEWLRIADEFKNTWNLGHCIGAIDGKHICIENPPNSGSLYYNYKGFYSIVLLAICDAKCIFTLLDVGQYGSNNDAGVLANSLLSQMLENNSLKLPSPAQLEGCN